jgi:glycosyltransferase involved in cell wall biosynthesis
MKHALIVPVYRNEESVPQLVAAVAQIARSTPGEFECVFVGDGSPDRSCERLSDLLPGAGFRSTLLRLSRNFGSFAAIRAGLKAVEADLYGMMAADLQEPPELVLEFFRSLREEPVDVVIGTREARADPAGDRMASSAFWALYRRFVQHDMPAGGFDLFGCTRAFRDHLLELTEVRSALVGQVLWLGFRRKNVSYERLARQHGKSAWTTRKKLDYLQDSIFAFTDLPIRLLLGIGLAGIAISLAIGVIVVVARLAGAIEVPGYAATILVVLFFAAINLFGLGIVGSYAWRAYENSKNRPESIVLSRSTFGNGTGA